MHRGGGNSLKSSHNYGFSLIETFNNLALWGEKKFVSELKRTYKFKRGVNCHTMDNSPKYHMVGNDVGLKSPTYISFKFWYRDFCSSLRANAKQSRETVITRSEKRRSNRIHIEKDEIATFRCTPLAMTEKRLRNKCAMTCDLFPRPFGERVRERGYLAASLLSRLAAFTLAEVLVTLGIIGVVSAMTVPTLMQNYQRQSYVTQLHKVYNETSQMLIQVMTDRNALNLNETGAFNNIENSAATFKKYFKVVHDCGATLTPCFASEYKSIDGTSTATAGECWYAVSLANGASICFTSMINDGNYPYIVTYVDVNGAKGPNISGRDYFLLQFYNNGTIEDAGIESECVVDRICTQPIEQQRLRYGCTNSAWPASCLGRILNDNWQMTY